MYNKYPMKMLRWSQIPYGEQTTFPKGVDCNAGYWPLNYFNYAGNGVFVNNNGRVIFWNIENPKDINFKDDMRELEYLLNNITQDQVKVADYWSSENLIENIMSIALKLLSEYNESQGSAARILSILSKSINDAYIIASYFKYFWDSPRPIQINKDLAVNIETPKSPSYPSIYSVVMATAIEILMYYFPKEKNKLLKIHQDMSSSRLYGGVHFKSDLYEGAKLGKQIGMMIVLEATKERDVKGKKIDDPMGDMLDADILPKY